MPFDEARRIMGVRIAEGQSYCLRVARDYDEASMFRHQAIFPDFESMLREAIQDGLTARQTVRVIHEDGLTQISALRDVVRQPRYNHPC